MNAVKLSLPKFLNNLNSDYHCLNKIEGCLKEALSTLMSCTPSNSRQPFLCHTQMADVEYFHVLSVFLWKCFGHKLRKVYWIWQVATVRLINHNMGTLKEQWAAGCKYKHRRTNISINTDRASFRRTTCINWRYFGCTYTLVLFQILQLFRNRSKLVGTLFLSHLVSKQHVHLLPWAQSLQERRHKPLNYLCLVTVMSLLMLLQLSAYQFLIFHFCHLLTGSFSKTAKSS